jgi:hypothetical protein
MPKSRKTGIYISIEQEDASYRRGDYLQLYPEKSLWQSVVDFINSLPDGTIFSRKELHYAVYEEETAKFHLKKGDMSTVDSYRGLLMKTPHLDKTKRPGRYIKKQQIPEEATLTKLKNFAKCKDYKKWFIPYEDWIK